MGYLGQRSLTGKPDAQNFLGANNWTVAFTPQELNIQVQFEVYHIAVSGPAGSTFQVYLDNTFYDYIARGDINSWDPAQPMHVRPGQSILFYWSTTSGPAPKVSLFCRDTTIF